MTTLELTVTDNLSIDGIVLAKYEEDSLWDFKIVSSDEPENYDPTWNQVERALESELYPDNSPVRMKDFY